MGLVELESMDDAEQDQVKQYIQEHVQYTNSAIGQNIIQNWDTTSQQFVKVMPQDYKRVLLERAEQEDAA